MGIAENSIGLIAGGFKPFTAGHYNLVQKASSECSTVKLFVSTGDRKRTGERAIVWNQMKPIWERYIGPSITALGNVEIHYVSQPIRSIYELLIAANEEQSNNALYRVYSDPDDIGNCYSDNVQMKYWARLVANQQIVMRPISREETAGISGTVMRKALAKGDMSGFISGLPAPVRIHGTDIFNSLT